MPYNEKLAQQLKTDKAFQAEVLKERNDFAKKSAEQEYKRAFSEELQYSGNNSLFEGGGLITRFFIKKSTLEKIFLNEYDKGFKESTGIELSKYEEGGAAKKADREKALNSILWTGIKVSAVIFALIGSAIGGYFGYDLLRSEWGSGLEYDILATSIGMTAGAAGGALLGSIGGALDGWAEKNETGSRASKTQENARNHGKQHIGKLERDELSQSQADAKIERKSILERLEALEGKSGNREQNSQLKQILSGAKTDGSSVGRS